MGTRLFVGNLSFATTEDALRELFSQHGEVRDCNLIVDKFSGKSRGFGFVEMVAQDAAQAAVTALNGTDLDGRKLTVNEARPREERPPRGRDDRGGDSRPPRRERRDFSR
jgi:cold-inducible RNA-binding protein